MVILQAGIYPKNYVLGLRGATKKECAICGSHMLHRLRVVRLGDDGKQSVVHVCFRNLCLRMLFRELGVSGVDEAAKIRSNSASIVYCTRCNRDARGGVVGKGKKFPVISDIGSVVEAYTQDKVNLCEVCFLEGIVEARSTKEFIAQRGGMD